MPSLRIKGFYLAVATLASQFFLEWAFGRIAWLYNYNDSGAIDAVNRSMFGMPLTEPYGDPVVPISNGTYDCSGSHLVCSKPDARRVWAKTDGHP